MKSRRLTKKLLAIGATVVLLLGAGVVTVFAVSQGAVAPKEDAQFILKSTIDFVNAVQYDKGSKGKKFCIPGGEIE